MRQKELEAMTAQCDRRLAAGKRRLVILSNLRLVTALAAFAGYVAAFRGMPALGWTAGIGFTLVFALLVRLFNRRQEDLRLEESRKAVLGRYLDRMTGKWQHFEDDGKRYIQADDHLSTDLDLFGPGSLYQYISVAHTVAGGDALMALLTHPQLENVDRRQEAVVELLQDDDRAVDFEALGFEPNGRAAASMTEAEQRLRAYALEAKPANAQTQLLGLVMPLVTLTVGLGALAGFFPQMAFVVCFFGQIAAALFLAGTVEEEKSMVLTLQRRLSHNEARIRELVDAPFASPYLKDMQQALSDAGAAIRSLNRLVSAWQLRENFIFFWPLAGLFAWDFNCLTLLGKWKITYGARFVGWMDWIGQAEALYSLGTLARVRPDDAVMPEIVESPTPLLRMTCGKHPLLDPATVVGNDYSQTGETVIITGSNMSGKSTFMRTLAMNAVLAYAGGSVAAQAFTISPMRIFTSMRVRDDVGAGISTFYGEILRIKEMVIYSQKQEPMLVLVDEIFKGTNSADRIIGAQAAIRKLTHPWMMTMVTTHDFELCALVETEEIRGKNFHFQESYEGDDIFFDYKIRPGRCLTTNAKQLMRMAGLLDDDQDNGQNEGDSHVL